MMNNIKKHITPLEDKFITKLIDRIRFIEGIIALILYGSRVSGFSNEDSDLDIALITNKSMPNDKLDRIKDELTEEMNITGELRIDLFSFTEEEIKHLPIGKEIEEKGLLLWKKDWNSKKAL